MVTEAHTRPAGTTDEKLTPTRQKVSKFRRCSPILLPSPDVSPWEGEHMLIAISRARVALAAVLLIGLPLAANANTVVTTESQSSLAGFRDGGDSRKMECAS